MRAFYSDEFALPLPEGHSFPMEKYTRLRPFTNTVAEARRVLAREGVPAWP